MSDSEGEIFNIKDPRPLTAKQRESGTEEILPPDQAEGDQSPANIEEPTPGAGGVDSVPTSPNKRSKSRKKLKKKGNKRGASSTQSIQQSVDQDVKSTNSTPNFKALKKAKSERLAKKITTPDNNTKSEQTPNVTGQVEIESTDEQKRKELKSESSIRSDTGLEKHKKSNLEYMLKLAKNKRSNKAAAHASSWSNPALAEDSNSNTPMETSGEISGYNGETPVDPQIEGPSKTAVQLDIAPEMNQCPKIRYTNLSLSMPNTREGRRVLDEDEDGGNCNWLFECKNIWSNSRKTHHYSGYQKTQTADKYSSYTPTKNEGAFTPTTSKSSNRFIYSMKSRSRISTMRTVKQGSFVLMGTVKTIRDDRDKFAFNF